MRPADWIQATLVFVLVLVTLYYAIQTHRMANLLKEQSDTLKAQIAENRAERARDLKAGARGVVLSWLAEVRSLTSNIGDWPAKGVKHAMNAWHLNKQEPVFRHGFRALADVVEAGLPWDTELLGIQSALTSLSEEIENAGDGRSDGAALESVVEDILDRASKLEMTVLDSADPSLEPDAAADTTTPEA